jgi:hypothetical protein
VYAARHPSIAVDQAHLYGVVDALDEIAKETGKSIAPECEDQWCGNCSRDGASAEGREVS